VPALLKRIFEQEGCIENDVGYDVNRRQNGMWLPSNEEGKGGGLSLDEVFPAPPEF
jgi:hypothetical protein